MTNLIVINNKEPRVSTLDIAEGVKKDHHSVKFLVKTYANELQIFGTLEVKLQKSKGRPTEFWLLNEQQTTFLITLMRNNAEVVNFKIKLVQEFNKMKKALNDVYIRQNNEEWIAGRNQGKISRKAETDVIKEFVEYCELSGSKNARKYYNLLTTMENKALFFLEQKYSNIRELLTGQQLLVLGSADQIIEHALKDGMEQNMDYHDIYKLAKERVEIFASVLPKTPIMMLSE